MTDSIYPLDGETPSGAAVIVERRRHPSIGIFIAADAHSQEVYDQNLQSIRCYAKRHNYDLILIDSLNQTAIPTLQKRVLDLTVTRRAESTKHHSLSCASISAFFFQRQCVATQILPFYDFLVIFDADDAVANADVTIESILLRASRKTTDKNDVFKDPSSMKHYIPHVIHEQRFHTGEIMAGNMILQNTDFAQAYMKQWIDHYFTLPEPQYAAPGKLVNKFYHKNVDNPSLSMVFLQTLARIVAEGGGYGVGTSSSFNNATLAAPHKSLIDNCHRLWKLSSGNQKYMNFIHCVEEATSQLAQDGKHVKDMEVMFPLYLYRRGHGGLGRDIQTCNGKVSPVDLIVHNLKGQSNVIKHVSGFYSERPTCSDGVEVESWQAPVATDRWKSLDEMKDLMKTPACLAKATNVGDCWPHCIVT
ncbi:MAG: hypothetical protein SGILL_000054 [Bacillariaceae sp.]